jgi:hypothetical protein
MTFAVAPVRAGHGIIAALTAGNAAATMAACMFILLQLKRGQARGNAQ